ncbi:MAG: hypothetical protein HY807_04565 [Nitrospirae bacterium]|nr:hypothetical protein [Nitrospirota bacterium]
MAKSIKDTPVLYGKDAERFAKNIKANESKRISKSEYDKAMASYNKILKNAKL